MDIRNAAILILAIATFFSCTIPGKSRGNASIIGTWKLLSGTTIAGKDTVNTDYTRGQEMIKIITPTHFAFMRHDLQSGKDSTAVYVAGGGRVRIGRGTYTEYLDYLNYREWEGHSFDMTFAFSHDTLVFTGIEKVEAAGVDHVNVERYVRVR